MFENKQKYVRLDNDEFIFFPVTIEHSRFRGYRIISAGFCIFGENEVSCFGESYSLKLKSDSEDSKLATKQIFGFDAMLELK